VAEDSAGKPSVNALASVQVATLIRDAAALRLAVSKTAAGATLIDAGIGVRGGMEAGRRIAEICMGGLGMVCFAPGAVELGNFEQIHVHSADPVLACLASQYAGWSLSHGEGKGAYQALASGPGRAVARREPLFDELGYADPYHSAVFVLEVEREPPPEIVVTAGAEGGTSTGLRQLTGLVNTLRVIVMSLGTRLGIFGSAPPKRMFSVLPSR